MPSWKTFLSLCIFEFLSLNYSWYLFEYPSDIFWNNGGFSSDYFFIFIYSLFLCYLNYFYLDLFYSNSLWIFLHSSFFAFRSFSYNYFCFCSLALCSYYYLFLCYYNNFFLWSLASLYCLIAYWVSFIFYYEYI